MSAARLSALSVACGRTAAAGEARRANDGQVFSHATQGRQAQLATGLRFDAADDVVLRIGGGGALFDDHHVDRHLDHFEDLEHRVIQRTGFGAGRIEQRRLGRRRCPSQRRIGQHVVLAGPTGRCAESADRPSARCRPAR